MEFRNIFFVSVLLVIAVMAVVGNLIVILAVLSHRRLQNPANYLIVNLAFADLLRGVISMPMRLVESLNTSKENLIRCDVVISFTILFYAASNVNLLLIALDRFVAISKPLSYQNIVRASNYKIVIVVMWIIVLIFSLCPVFGWRKQVSGSAGSVCRFNTILKPEYHILFVVFIVAIPLAIMLVTYTYIFRATRKQIKQIRAHEVAVKNAAINLAFEHEKNTLEQCESCSHATEEEAAKTTTPPPVTEPECDEKETSFTNNNVLEDPSKRQSETLTRQASVTTMKVEEASPRKVPLSTVRTRKATRTVLAIIGFFFVLCIPIAIMDVIEFWCDSCGEIPKWVSTVALCMVYANSCVNVFVYGGYNTEYRTAYRNVWINTKKVFCRPFLRLTKLKNSVAAESPTDQT